MPIKIQSDLPVKELLEKEKLFVMDENRAMHQDIRPIYIPEDKKAVVEVKKQTEGYKKKFHVALFFTIVLSAAIVTMFGITYVSGHSPYVVDYENELIDKYENWQKELEKREKAVEEREKALDERQDATEWTK